MYALVDFEADITATRMRKCECVIDVLVERGCKYFVGDLGDLVRIKMKDLVSDAFLYITAEIRMSLKLEYEYDDERMGHEHTSTYVLERRLLAGQKRLDRDELLHKENQRAKATRRERNPHILYPIVSQEQELSIDSDENARKESAQRKWSDPFVLDQAGTIGEIEADDFGANRKYSVGYSITPAKGQYSRTKVIMLTPRFMLINTMSSAIEVCHSSAKIMTPSVIDMTGAAGSMPNSRVMSPVNPVVQLDAGAFADFHWTLRFAKTRTIRCRFTEYGWSWSGAVPLGESGEYAVRMRHESTRESKLVRVALKLDSSCLCVYFREERTTAPPYRVENYSLETLRTHQHRVRRSEILLPHHSLDYAWDEPTEDRLLVVDMLPSAAGDNSRPLRIGSFDLDKIQQYPDALGGTLGIEISTDGPTRVLRFTDTRLRMEKAMPVSTQTTNDMAAKAELSERSGMQVLQRFVIAPTVHAALRLQGVGISIVDNAPKELLYMSVDEQKKLYFEEFHIDPIRATVSFSFGDSAGAIMDGNLPSLSHAAALTGPSSSRDSSVTTVGPLRLILNAIGTSLTKIANAPFQLKALHIHNSFVQPDALATRLASHYQSEALRQAYVILGSVDVLGNPMIAWKNLRSGFQDFISEPAHGLSQRSPQAFAFGVGRGSLSLVRASVYTFLDFNTRILTAFSLGLSEACLKLDDYTGYPATRHIFQGLVQGVSGVVVAPIHSFEVNGARGVLPGFVAGAFGVVLKPLLGFSLATATTAATLRDAVDPNTKALLVRVRPPRHIDLRTRRLKVYSYVESLGEEIVGKIRGGRYRTDGYLGHVDLKGSHQCFLVTRKRILFLNVKTAASTQATKYDVQWELLAEEVVMVDCSRTPNEQMITIYYMEDEFRSASGAGHSTSSGASSSNAVTTHRRRTPGVPRGMFLQKHEVALPDTKVLFVRAMLQQQERSLLTKMNSYTGTDEGTLHHVSLSRTPSMELTAPWQPQHQYMPLDYPVFRLPPSLHPTRSFANLAQATPSHLQGHHAQHHDNLNEH
ncbi:hypothetical protein BBO99_00003097 [Phytophthora kernoviae]|uniref:Vacuolar protein sorting-associated protein 13 DH-like domain-containing protein n=2 Tax=Phytophthora kernoviae TaxID=325452 RepID=A0A3R7MVF3_9STRA|nr:hypothetical protein G195_003232 [Phytophthora kernoviae 00238/432]KAG2528894.1 hypothetical protein JM16_000941 [Phytophthora kernoviae]KAG2530222.1 hypothetical protein JM18_001022 [Phytophthora kernoviae]RLN44204.1 hypothetical protein BBI17_002962 [Phytophthora kernoviae]RLN82162.1 hypothetical protein BBO99_00003097 [Phytophthora kernoviae]